MREYFCISIARFACNIRCLISFYHYFKIVCQNTAATVASGGSRPGPGGSGPPVVLQAPPAFLGTNYDALSAVLMDCNICVASVYCLYSDHELIDLSYYVYLDIWRL